MPCSKYDAWSFYRKQLSKLPGGVKAVDIIAVEPKDINWLIEIKDYRVHRRTKIKDFGEDVALKVRDTLAGLAAARVNARDTAEKTIAQQSLSTSRIKVVLHLEQPSNPSRLNPGINTANMLIKLSQCIKAIDPHPKIMNKDNIPSHIKWTVSENSMPSEN